MHIIFGSTNTSKYKKKQIVLAVFEIIIFEHSVPFCSGFFIDDGKKHTNG